MNDTFHVCVLAQHLKRWLCTGSGVQSNSRQFSLEDNLARRSAYVGFHEPMSGAVRRLLIP
jgi:hypothetical protein